MWVEQDKQEIEEYFKKMKSGLQTQTNGRGKSRQCNLSEQQIFDLYNTRPLPQTQGELVQKNKFIFEDGQIKAQTSNQVTAIWAKTLTMLGIIYDAVEYTIGGKTSGCHDSL